MSRSLNSPDAPTVGRQTFTFSDPFVLRKAQGQTAYLRIYLGKSMIKKTRAPISPTNTKKQTKTFVRSGQISYRNLASVSFKDRINKKDELRLTFSNLHESEHEALLKQLSMDAEVEMILGVVGLWSLRRRMVVKEIGTDNQLSRKLTFTLHDTGVKAGDSEETRTFNNKSLSAIYQELGRMAGMKVQVEINEDPIIPHIAMARRSIAKTAVDLAEKYGLYVKFANNVLYVQELMLDDQPSAKYTFGGPRGNVFKVSVKGSVVGLKGGKTTAKRRKQTGKDKDSKSSGDDNNPSLKITYKQNGSYTKRQTFDFSKGGPFETKKPRQRAKQGGRTIATGKTGKEAARVAKGAHIKRTLKVKSGSLIVINEPITPNTNLLIAGISDVFGGKFYAGDVSYDWTGGYWRVSTKVNGKKIKGKGKGKTKQQRGKSKKKNQVKAKPVKPRLVVTYKRDGSYDSKKVGYKRARQ